jgi:hypothetical protein
MTKGLIFLMTFTLLALAGCSSDAAEKQATESDNGPAGSARQEAVAGAHDGQKGLSVPQGYPEEVVPIMPGKIVGGASGPHEVWVKFMVDTELDAVAAYYKDVLSKGKLINALKMGDDLYMIDGEVGGKSIDIKVSSVLTDDSFKANVMITIKGDFGPLQEKSGAAGADQTIANKDIQDLAKLPADYPLDLVPLYGGSKITHAEKTTYNGKVIFLVKTISTADKDAVHAFYKEVLQEAKDKEEAVLFGGKMYTLGGVTGKYKTSLLFGNNNIEGNSFKSLCTIQIDILK